MAAAASPVTKGDEGIFFFIGDNALIFIEGEWIDFGFGLLFEGFDLCKRFFERDFLLRDGCFPCLIFGGCLFEDLRIEGELFLSGFKFLHDLKLLIFERLNRFFCMFDFVAEGLKFLIFTGIELLLTVATDLLLF